MAETKVQVEGQWIDHISDKAASTLRDLRNEFSATSIAEKALGNLTADSIKEFIRGAFEKANELTNAYVGQERAETRLVSALQKTGQARGDAAGKLVEYASQMEKATRFDDENIQAAETLALTLGKMRADDVIPMTEAAMDLASALGSDVTEAMRLLIKGGEGASAALSRVGIQFTSTGDAARDSAALLQLVRDQFGGLAQKEMGPVEQKLREINKAIEDNDKTLGKDLSNFTIWVAKVREGLSNTAVAWKDYWAAANPGSDVAGNSAYDISMADASNMKSGAGVGGPWGISGTPSWAQPVAGLNLAQGFIGPAGPPGGSASAQSTWLSESEERARKLQQEIDLYGKLGLAKRDAAAADASFSDLSRLADDARRQGGMLDLGKKSSGVPADWHDYFQTKKEAEAEQKAFEEAHQRAASVASTLVNGLRQVEEQGKVTFRTIGTMIARILEDIAWQQAQKGLTSFLTNIFDGGGGGSSPGPGSTLGGDPNSKSVDAAYGAARGR